MLLIVCLDDTDGMMFGGRRQSKDRMLRTHMLSICRGRTLWMSPYSATQFDSDDPVTADTRYADAVKQGDACFIEDGEFPRETPRQILLYRWNRRYPADRVFPAATLHGYRLVSREEFVGSSHECITAEYYETEGSAV